MAATLTKLRTDTPARGAVTPHAARAVWSRASASRARAGRTDGERSRPPGRSPAPPTSRLLRGPPRAYTHHSTASGCRPACEGRGKRGVTRGGEAAHCSARRSACGNKGSFAAKEDTAYIYIVKQRPALFASSHGFYCSFFCFYCSFVRGALRFYCSPPAWFTSRA